MYIILILKPKYFLLCVNDKNELANTGTIIEFNTYMEALKVSEQIPDSLIVNTEYQPIFKIVEDKEEIINT